MKIMKRLLLLLILVGVMFGNIIGVSAKEIETYSEIPTELTNYGYLSGIESPADYIGYFTGSRSGYKPLIKYVGADKDHIEYYLFCLSYHKKAPVSSITYELDDKDGDGDIDEDDFNYLNTRYAYIIDRGFNSRGSTYADLLWAYYVTSMAIYQFQYEKGELNDSSSTFVDIRTFTTSDNVAKQAILDIVDGALDDSNFTDGKYEKFVPIYTPSSTAYQSVAANIMYTFKSEPEPEPEPEPEIPNTPTPQVYPQIQISYKSKCTNTYANAKLQLINTSGKVFDSWVSKDSAHVTKNIPAGTYTLKDLTNKQSKQIVVKDQTTMQTFELYPEEVCEVPKEPEKKEPNPDTGIKFNTMAIGGLSVLAMGIFFYSRKNKKFKI